MSAKLLVICHCEWNAVERRNRKVFGIATLPFGNDFVEREATSCLRYPAGTLSANARNDDCLTGHGFHVKLTRMPTELPLPISRGGN